MSPVRTGLLVLAALVAGAQSVRAQEAPSWPEVKCARYREAWAGLVARRGTAGLGRDFLASHEAFLASGCTDQGHVCPRAPAELEVANMLTILAMNAGTASTFLPFGCRAAP